MIALLCLTTWAGVLLVATTVHAVRPPFWRKVADLAGVPAAAASEPRWPGLMLTALESSPLLHPWASRQHLSHLVPAADSDAVVATVRWRQVRSLIACLLAVTAWGMLRRWTHPSSGWGLPLALACLALPFSGWLVRWRLGRAHQVTVRSIEAQLPAVLELLAFAIAAGEGMLAAVRRVAQTARGPLPRLLSDLAVQMSAGASLADELVRLAERSGSVAVARASHAITVATQRGTPLADVLRAQAEDARAEHLRHMLELAGRRESAMMLPVVFLILPVIVIVAVYPGMVALRVW